MLMGRNSVKVEVWDVVDEGKKRNVVSEDIRGTLKLNNNSTFDTIACDASVIDVYKNTHGVIFIFDITKNWTWQYVQRELSKIDKKIPVLIMANKNDLDSERVIEDETCEYFLKELERTNILFTSSSMKTAHGLRYLHSFFNLPFLHLQKDVLERCLKQNQCEISLAYMELNSFYKESKREQVSDDDSFINDHYEVESNHVTNECVNKLNEKFKEKKILSSDDDDDDELEGNNMVDMYEDDFDSADDFNQKLKMSTEILKCKNWDNSTEPSNVNQNQDISYNKDLCGKNLNYGKNELFIEDFTSKSSDNTECNIVKIKSISSTEISDFEIDNIKERSSNENSVACSDIPNKVQTTTNISSELSGIFNNSSDKSTSSCNLDVKKKSKKIKKEKRKKSQGNNKIYKRKTEEEIIEINKIKQKNLLIEDSFSSINNDIICEYDPI
ncbi:Rab-like protein 6 [Strongyloides ratti]|uniref:Rab-like protein 6 n=1 Tax=Strongyloides ratti TaxID=34506 RepID=A0A090L5Y5_STRRB|nr:Rab-like protein 6 [Strongyloides ratti]CEF63537.1 Rab-like protein 6 [Strongyloides ratti]